MTSTSDIERDLEELAEGLIGDLDPDDRATLAVELLGAGETEKAAEVKQGAPLKTYEARDLDFMDRVTDNFMMALYAMWELDSGVWKFFYKRTHGMLAEANYRQFPDEDWTEEPTPENGFHEQEAMDAAAEFLGDYLFWQRYANEEVGVDLETFLKHPFGGAVDHKIALIGQVATLADEGALDSDADIDDAGWAANGSVTVGREELSAEEWADRKHQERLEAVLR